MDFNFQSFASILNFIVSIILLCNIYRDYTSGGFTQQYFVLGVLRCIAVQFMLISEFEALKPYYIENFKAFMFPKGRAICYFIFAFLCFSTIPFSLISVAIIVIIGLFTLYYKSDSFDHSPYVDPSDKSNPNSNTTFKSTAPYHQPKLYNQVPAFQRTSGTSPQPLIGKQPRQ